MFLVYKLNLLILFFSLTFNFAFSEELLRIYDLATENDSDLKIAAEKINEYDAQRISALSKFHSTLDFNIDSRWNRFNSKNPLLGSETREFGTNEAGFTINKVILNNVLDADIKISDLQLEKIEFEYLKKKNKLILDVLVGYFEILKFNETKKFILSQKKAVKEQLEQAKRNFIVGTATITDQREAQAKFDLVFANEINITNEIENSIDSLELIAGNNLENDFPSLLLPVKLLNPSPDNVDDWVNLSKSNNYDIKISNINTLIEEKKLLSAQSEMDSNLSAFSSATYSDGSNFGAYESTTVIAGLRFNLPLYKGAKVLSNTAMKNSKLKQSIEALKNSEKQVFYDVKKSFSKLKSSLAMVEALKQANLSTKLQLEASKLGLEVGVRTAIDVLNSEQQMSDVNNQLFSAVVDSIISHAQLKYYAGVLTLSDLKKINGLLQ